MSKDNALGKLDGAGLGARRWTGSAVVRDTHSERRKRIEAILESIGITSVRLRAPPGAAPRAAFALVALEESNPAGDQMIPELVDRGMTVLAYGPRAARWSLSRRSRVLLMGAVDVMDSTRADFESDLRTSLAELQARRADDERRGEAVVGLMEGLGLVGRAPAMMRVYRWMLRAREVSDLPVLIRGETGTGKELVARALHRLDPKRVSGRFVALNCAALSSSLAEAELFGHRRGAFTGASHQREGLVRSAEGGVLFLDEIGELDLALQAKLLRVLQERRVLALGEDRERTVDVRIVAATNRDLRDMVREGRFREDLLYRLDTLSVSLPPLRERRGDIPSLVEHFLCERTRPPHPTAGDGFLEALAWMKLPGNVRELGNIVAQATIRSRGASLLRLRDLPPQALRELSAAASASMPEVPPGSEAPPSGRRALVDLFESEGWELGRCLAECERVLVEEAIRRSSGNRTRAARLLGVSPRTIYSKLQKHQLKG